MATVRVASTGGSCYPLTGGQLVERSYDPLVRHLYRSTKAYKHSSIQDFASSPLADICDGKIVADIDVRICINGKKYRFFVDPHNKRWFDHLRSHIAAAVGLDSYLLVDVVVSGSVATGSSGDLDALSSAAPYTVVVRLSSSKELGTALPPLPSYRTPFELAQRARAQAAAAAAVVVVSKEKKPSFSRSRSDRRTIEELVAKLRDGIRVPSERRDYGTVRGHVISQLADKDFYGGEDAQTAFWQTTGCTDIGSAINELSSDVASRLCKIGEGLGSSATPELLRQGLIGCSIWDQWTHNMCRWGRKRHCRVPCPTEAPGCGYADEHLHRICAPMGSEAVRSIQEELIAASIESPYPIGCAHDDDGYSSGEEPSRESLACALKKKHYRCSSTYYTIPTPSCEPKCTESKKKEKFHYSDTIALVPIENEALASIGAKTGRLTLGGHHHGTKGSSHGTMPHGKPPMTVGSELDGLTNIGCDRCGSDHKHHKKIGCRTCGHGCTTCGTKLCSTCGKCPTCTQCGHPATIDCHLCEQKAADVQATAAAPSPLTSMAEAKQTMPDYGRVSVCFTASKEDAVVFRILHGGKTEIFRSPVIKRGMPICTAPDYIPSGKYSIVAQSSDGKALGELQDRMLFHRNTYTFDFDGKNVVIGSVGRFDEQKRALASEFLTLASIKALSTKQGVVFAPSNDALKVIGDRNAINALDYFVSGNPVELLKKRSRNAETSSEELTLASDSGKSTFIRNDDGTKIWNHAAGRYERILGTAALSNTTTVVVMEAVAGDLKPGVF